MYSRSGDKGETSLYGGQRAKKFDPRVEAYGELDELNSFMGLARSSTRSSLIRRLLFEEQVRLFKVSADIATPLGTKTPKQVPRVGASDVAELESAIDSVSAKIRHINRFVVVGSSRESALLHCSRAICRRAERAAWPLIESGQVGSEVGRYLNRLSSLLFVLARYSVDSSGLKEDLWNP
jgi:cob(I)alamin adenosyltransferase